MSLSNGPGTPLSPQGRVILGAGSLGLSEMTVGQLEGQRPREFNEEAEARFWERIREKAQSVAAQIVAAAAAEAGDIREKARQEGYAKGLEDASVATEAAHAEMQRHLDEMGQSLGRTLEGLKAERAHLWASYRQDAVTLVRLALEKTLNVELVARRQEVLTSLLDEALELIDSQTSLTIRLNPEDESVAQEMLERFAKTNSRLTAWRIKADPAITAGGVIVESDDGLVDNSLESRLAGVQEILAKLDSLGEENGA